MKTTATAPAWQVREHQRQKLLEKLHQKVIAQLDNFKTIDLFRVLLFLLDKKLATLEISISASDFPEISWATREIVFGLFCEMSQKIGDFQRSEEEGHALLAMLFQWVADNLANPHHAALQTQELCKPELIYGTERATDEVPLG